MPNFFPRFIHRRTYLHRLCLAPVNNLLTEFLPDVASHVHIHIIFVQRTLNNVASGNNATTLP